MEPGSFSRMFKLCKNAGPRILNRQIKELDFVMNALTEAKQTAIEEKTWQESVESWIALRDLLPVVRAQRAVYSMFCSHIVIVLN